MKVLVIYLLMIQKLINLNEKTLTLMQLLCLRNISKDFSVDNIKKAGLYGFVNDFSVYHDIIIIDDVLSIHNYLMKNKG